jgi:hypothetical protein
VVLFPHGPDECLESHHDFAVGNCGNVAADAEAWQ